MERGRTWVKRLGEVCCRHWQRSLTYMGIAFVFLSPNVPNLASRCTLLP